MIAKGKLRLSMLVLLVLIVAASPCLSVSWPIQCGRYLAPITSAFGPRCQPQNSFHAGMDVRIWETRNVVAVAAGTVVDVSVWTGYDWSVIIQHGAGENAWYSGYHHMNQQSDIDVGLWQPVTEGQTIAIAGSNHLHFNYWKGGDIPDDDNNTKHPLRLFGDSGEFSIYVSCPCVPHAAIVVSHCGLSLPVIPSAANNGT